MPVHAVVFRFCFSVILCFVAIYAIPSGPLVRIHGVERDVPAAWLRDHCKECGNFGAQGVGARAWDAFVNSLNVSVKGIKDDFDQVVITWSDNRSGLYTKDWLNEHAPSAESTSRPLWMGKVPDSWLRERTPWAGSSLEIQRMDATNVSSAAWRLQCFKLLRRYGVVLLTGAPLDADDQVQERWVEKFLPIHEVDYGKIWTTQGYGIPKDQLVDSDKTVSWLSARVEGDTQQPLESHTDGNFWSDPAGLIMFHMVEKAGEGGETVLTDGLAAAWALFEQYPEAYRILSEVEVTWSYKPADKRYGHHNSSGTILRVDPATERLLQFRWSNKDRNLMQTSVHDAERFYWAYHKLALFMNDASFKHTISLEPGSFLLLDNWRVTHGRTPYTGKRTLKGAYVLRDVLDSQQRALEEAEALGYLTDLDRPKPDIRTSLRRLDEGTSEEFKAQGELWAALVQPSALTQQVLRLLRSMDGEHTRFGFPVNGFEHSLQTATRAYRDGADEESVVIALLHDVGEAVFSANHGEIVAAMLRPFLTEQSYFILKYHDLFQGYHYAHHFGMDRNAREKLKDSPYYEACVHFVGAWDQMAFDSSYSSSPLIFFEPMVRRVLERDQYGFDPMNTKNVVAWKATDYALPCDGSNSQCTAESSQL